MTKKKETKERPLANQEETPTVSREVRRKTQEKQLMFIVGAMVVLIAVSIFVYSAINSSKKFDYAGLNFEKIMYGKLPLYHTKIPVTYQGSIANYNIYLRNDPRTLKDIPINGTIRLMKKTTISVDPAMDTLCSDNIIASQNLNGLMNVAGIDVGIAYTDKTFALENNKTYASCNESGNQSVIIIKQSDTNRIVQESPNCYTVEFKQCEILKSSERFMVGLIANSNSILI